MPARIIIDVEKDGAHYHAQIAGTGIGGYGVDLDDAMEGIAVWLGDAATCYGTYSQQDRDIAARIMAEIEGEQ